MARSTDAAAPPSLTIERRFKAPREKVYAAWTNPALLSRWFGPPRISDVRATCDLKVGGRYHIKMVEPSGEEHSVGGVYREIVPNERLVFTWAWGTTPERESLVTVAFDAEGAETLLTLTHEQFVDDAARDRHNEGWKQGLHKLSTLLGSAEAAGHGVPHGKFCWHELMTRDVEGTKAFYAETLGWSYDRFPGPAGSDYWIIKVAGEGIGGILDISDKSFEGLEARWVTYVAVDDVDRRVALATSKGAKVMKPAMDIPGVGRIVFLLQPDGAMVAWMTPRV